MVKVIQFVVPANGQNYSRHMHNVIITVLHTST